MTATTSRFEEASRYIAGGVNSPVRAFRSVGGEPPFIRRARGAHVETEDGRRLIVRLTPTAGRRIWELIGPHIAESTAVVAEGFATEELEAVRRFLETITSVQRAHVVALRERDAFGGIEGSS